jgi:hypothetical protein
MFTLMIHDTFRIKEAKFFDFFLDNAPSIAQDISKFPHSHQFCLEIPKINNGDIERHRVLQNKDFCHLHRKILAFYLQPSLMLLILCLKFLDQTIL